MAVTAFLTLGVGWAGAQQNRAIEILQRAQDLQAGTDQAVLETEGLAPGQESAEPGALGDSLGSIGSSAETPAELGREADDEGAVLNLFEDPEIRKLLGENPRFIYNASERPDPMIFPATRNAAIFIELSAEAEQLVRERKLIEAIRVYERIVELADRRYFLEARRKINALRAEAGLKAAEFIAEEEIVAELPGWVPSNTRGILYDENFQICLVGDFLLRPGDPVPTYPEVSVESISPSLVVYRMGRQTFEVPVTGYEEFGAAGNLTPISVVRGR